MKKSRWWKVRLWSLCPGAPVMVAYHLLVWNFYRGVSMVIPSPHSTFGVSETQTYFKEPLPTSAASCSNFPVFFFFLSIPPLWRSSGGRPVLVHVSGDNGINANLFLFPFGLDLGMVFISVFWWQICCEKVGLTLGRHSLLWAVGFSSVRREKKCIIGSVPCKMARTVNGAPWEGAQS